MITVTIGTVSKVQEALQKSKCLTILAVNKNQNKIKVSKFMSYFAVGVGQGIPDEVGKSMATKAGVDALMNGTKSFETKLILKAGTF